ncbi:hypothetical protein BC351_00810 [Paenibacillus ferrarius]|uniref:Uncharacterized protein n=1 Tax=Paenibacillus ferrarius TaxID=1469647 RepID=A0A1V4HTI1_9BACL|nr:hypothetical protein [Paenibacillus ferrarius]OPH61813.1 hypothetical protein BC351_00810 [Paenibacillus ferrarius]
MRNYTIRVPDSNKPALRISGIKFERNPFEVLGSITLEKTKSLGGLPNYTVVDSDLYDCFPIGERFWNIGDMFCNSCNDNIHSYNWNNYTQAYEKLWHKSNMPIYSKHKIDDKHWKILIYKPSAIFDEPVFEMIEKRLHKVEFTI